MKPYAFGPAHFGGRPRHGGSLTGAFVLICIGIVFLTGAVLPGMSFERVFQKGWPVLLLVIGLSILVRQLLAPLALFRRLR